MRNPCSIILWLTLATILSGGLAATQEIRIRWLEKPGAVAIPADSIVGISVSGRTPGAVWIADERAPLEHRLLLAPIAPGRYAVALDDPKLARIARLGKRGSLRVFVSDSRNRWSTGEPLAYRWGGHSAAPSITIPQQPAFFLVKQRSMVEVPGSAGSLKVRLGDISGGAVGLTAWVDGKRHVRLRFVRAGNRISLPLARPARLQVLRLVNMLFGEDYALLMVCAEPPSQQTLIEAVIQQARHVGFPCYHGDDQLQADEIERRMRKSLAAWPAESKTLAGFLTHCAKDPDLPTHYRWVGEKRQPFIELLRRFAASLEQSENTGKKPGAPAKPIRRAG